MNKVIDAQKYNTETATLIMEWSAGQCSSDWNWEETGLYRTKSGAFFLAGEGGPRTMWATDDGHNNWGSGRGIRPISRREAVERILTRTWSEQDLRALGFPPLEDRETWRRYVQGHQD